MSQYKVRNWPEYSKSLENRGNLSFWVSEDALKKWSGEKDPHFIGAPQKYSDAAILCAMMLKVVYRLPYRQLVGFLTFLFQVMNLNLPIPHFTTIAERAKSLKQAIKRFSNKRPTDIVFDSSGFKIYGEGEWKVRQHGKQKRRRWKKFHIGICPSTQEIIVAEVTELESADCKVAPKMIQAAPRSVKNIIGDGAYDTIECYKAAYENGAHLLAPPRHGAVIRDAKNPWEVERNKAIATIIGLGNSEESKKLWKKLTGYHRRSLVETAFSRFKGIFGSKLFSKSTDNQDVELMVKALALNGMTKMGMPMGVMI
jgi:hypothetical protein